MPRSKLLPSIQLWRLRYTGHRQLQATAADCTGPLEAMISHTPTKSLLLAQLLQPPMAAARLWRLRGSSSRSQWALGPSHQMPMALVQSGRFEKRLRPLGSAFPRQDWMHSSTATRGDMPYHVGNSAPRPSCWQHQPATQLLLRALGPHIRKVLAPKSSDVWLVALAERGLGGLRWFPRPRYQLCLKIY